MAVDGYLNFLTKINTKGFNAGTKQIANGLSSVKSMLGKVGVSVSSAFAVHELVSFGKEAVNMASDIQEVQNVVDVSFGRLKGHMEDFASTSIQTYGISKLTAKQTGSTYMAMAKGMQIADDAAADMAIALTGLSADMASFYNKEQNVTATALNSIFTGETETLKQFGIVMTEANLQSFAYTQGINKKISAMSQAEKVQLRYNYVMQQTALAQGDFVRTQDGWANQTRIISEQWREFSGTVGTILMNTLLPAVQTLNKSLTWLNTVAQNVLETLSAIFDWEVESNSGDSVSDVIDTAVDNQNELTDAVEETIEAQKRELMGFDKINKLSDGSASSSLNTEALNGIITGSNTVSVDMKMDTSDAETKLTTLQQKLKDFISSLKITFSDVFVDWEDLTGEQIAEKIITALGALAGGVIGFSIGGVPGAIVGTLLGVVLSLVISSLTFDHDGKLSGEEILSLITMALTSIAGGFIGFSISGVTGAAIGITVGASIGFLINQVAFNTDGELTGEEIAKYVIMALGAVAGGIIGFSMGGAAGATIGIAIGTSITMGITALSFDNDGNLSTDEIVGMIVTALSTIAGGVIGFSVGGVPGAAVVGAALGMCLSLFINKVDWSELWIDISTGFTNILKDLKTWFEKKKSELKEDWENFTSVVKDKTAKMKAEISTKFIDFQKAWKEFPSLVKDKAAEMKAEIKSDIKKFKKNWAAFSSVVKDKTAKMKAEIKSDIKKFKKSWEAFPSLVKSKTAEMKAKVATKYDDFKKSWNKRANLVKNKTVKFKTSFSDKVEDVKKAAEDRFMAIVDVFAYIPGWFRDTFAFAWKKVKEVFSSGGDTFEKIKEGILDGLKAVINGLIDGINAVIATPFNGINTALEKIKNTTIAGSKPFYNKISFINVPAIPKLATGTVVPANYGEFLAVLGDNKRETEVVSPLSTIKQAVAEVVGSGKGEETINLVIELDSEVVYRKVVKKNKQNTKMTGVNELATA